MGPGLSCSPTDKEASSPEIVYDLMGVVNHQGNLHQGHYVSKVKVRNKWYGCNDAFISECEKDVPDEEGAYILFYMMR